MPLLKDICPALEDIHCSLVRVADPWIEQGPTSKMKVLRVSPESGGWTVLIHWKKGHTARPHMYLGEAQVFVVSGKLQVRDGVLNAGDFVYEPSGVLHEATTALEDTAYLIVCDGSVLYFDDDHFVGYTNWETIAQQRDQAGRVGSAVS